MLGYAIVGLMIIGTVCWLVFILGFSRRRRQELLQAAQERETGEKQSLQEQTRSAMNYAQKDFYNNQWR